MEEKRKKIFITGHTGDIGSRLKQQLEAEGEQVIVQSNSNIRIENEDYFSEVDNPESIDVLYHLAALTFVPLSWEVPDRFIKVNVLGTTNVLEFCRKNEIKLIFVSSYMYGKPKYLPIDESHPVSAVNPYGLSKRLGEEICRFYGGNYSLTYNIIRPFNIFGSLRNKKMLIPEIIDQIENGSHIEVKDLLPKRDYIFIDDVIEFLSKARFSFGNDVYNLGSGSSYSVKEIIDTCQEVWGTNYAVLSEKMTRKNEIPETISDQEKVKQTFDWVPRFSLKKGLEMMKKRIKKEEIE